MDKVVSQFLWDRSKESYKQTFVTLNGSHITISMVFFLCEENHLINTLDWLHLLKAEVRIFSLSGAAVWMLVYHPRQFICWNPNPKGDGDRRFGLWQVIRYWRLSLQDEISVFIKDIPDSWLVHSALWGHSKKSLSGKQARQTLNLLTQQSWTSPPPALREINFCCL